MLRVTLELLPHGSEAMSKRLGDLSIVNTGAGTRESGDYLVTLGTKKEGELRLEVRQAEVFDWPRLECGPWELVAEAIRAALNSEVLP